jgi:hypothetical protein
MGRGPGTQGSLCLLNSESGHNYTHTITAHWAENHRAGRHLSQFSHTERPDPEPLIKES